MVVDTAQFLLFIPVNHDVVEAVSPSLKPMRVDVAFSVWLKLVPTVKGKVPPPAPVASLPSQSPDPPVMAVQKLAKDVPYVPKRLAAVCSESVGIVDVAEVEVAWKYSATTGPTTESLA